MKTSLSRLRSRASSLNLLFMGLALSFLWIAVGELRVTAKFADLFYLKATLSEADSANGALIGRYAAEADTVVTANECRNDVLQGGLVFIMRDLDLQDPVNNYDAWAASITRADRYVGHALACNPGDADLWARLAMIRQATSENAEQLAALMGQSALLSPSELYVLRARFVVWRKATAATLARSTDTVERDIRTVLNYADRPDILDVLGQSGANLKPHILAAAKLIPAARLATLKNLHIDPAML